MRFVYIHILWFGCWIGFGVEKYPYGLLTMIVSLEAIFLSTFVMISQNRADAKRQVVADQQWRTVRLEDRQNRELLTLSNEILELTKAIHASTRWRFESVRGPEVPANQELLLPVWTRCRRWSWRRSVTGPFAGTSWFARTARGRQGNLRERTLHLTA
jgi:uncharacterized membrane protein